MSVEPAFRSAIQEYIRAEAKPVEKYSHQPRLYRLTRQIGKDLRYDDDVVFAATWLHDLGVFAGHRPEDPEQLGRWDNTAYACQRAPEVLRRLGFPAEKIPAVVEAIRTHQPSADPQTLEGTILRDADILEQLGSVAVLRAVCKIGRDTRFSTFSDVIPVLRKALDSLPERLRLERARELARGRIASLAGFLRSVEAESGGELD
ncbi:MAG TPA: HD domain-containing protein [Candidatus Binataceae bacterium]|nr:HD domain-containing protein [Candidatus Binataceae bacterium]